jgi:hypothetical protein
MDPYERNNDITADVLSLVSIQVPLEIIASWSDQQCEDAERWASAELLKASDNLYIRKIKMPEFLAPWKE